MRFSHYAAALCLCAASVPASADTTIKMDQTVDGRAATSTIRIHEGVIRMDSSRNPGSYVLFDTRSDTMKSVQTAEKVYTVIDTETLRNMGGMMQQMMARMEAQLANLPPQQRERVRRMMKQRMGGMLAGMHKKAPEPDPEIVRTGRTNSVGGHTCEVVTIRSPQVDGTICLTPYEDLGMSQEDYQTMLAMQEMARAMAESFGGDMPKMQNWLEGGVAVQYEQSVSGINVSGTLTEINAGSLSEDLFTVPAGFEKRSLDKMMQGTPSG